MKFYDELTSYYEEVFPLAAVKVAWLKTLVKQHQVHSFLDVGCATGALCQAMSKLVDQVEGFDLDEVMISKARQDRPEKNVRYLVGDMLDMNKLFQGKVFDMITCFGNTLVHLNREGLVQSIENIYEHLSDKGLFVGQILNYDYVLDEPIKELPLIENETLTFQRFYTWDQPSSIHFSTTLRVKSDHETYKNTIILYPIRRAELESVLYQVGFKEVVFYKDYNGNIAEGKHLPLIFIAKG